MTHTVQQLEKEGAKAISLQPDEPIIFEDESYVMGKALYEVGMQLLDINYYFIYALSVVGEERIVLQPHALEDPPVKELIKVNAYYK